jgi:hypothetical protein
MRMVLHENVHYGRPNWRYGLKRSERLCQSVAREYGPAGWQRRGLISSGSGRKLIVIGCPTMPLPLSAPEVLNREFLEIRCKILDLAAAFDRLSRAEGAVDVDPRMARLREALTLLLEENQDRAEQVQMIFSRAYDDAWRKTMKVK